METRTLIEQRLIKFLVTRYSDEGFKVIEEPSPEQLPDFLAGCRPDLLLQKPGRSVAVKVTTRASLDQEPGIYQMARLVREKPGWDFEIAVVNSREQFEASEDALPLTKEDTWEVIAESERLLLAGFPEAALMRAWGAAEAIVRLLVEEAGWLTDRPTSRSILTDGVHYGEISHDDYVFLHHALRQCNAIAHGMTPPSFDDGLVDALIGTTKRLLEMPPP